MSSTVDMMSLTEEDKKIVNEFCQLLDKSKQLFNGLRDLPQYGHKQWQAYFGRTFDVYTKLWKFQQQHRQVLDMKYGLKRWQIGEMASKIGQLYYHYYLRTSETNYLNEAFSFYSAIRTRAYYSKASKEERKRKRPLTKEESDLMVKKLRYYARFIVVCLLLKKMKLVKDLVKELSRYIEEYGSTYEPDDHFLSEAGRLLLRSANIDPAYVQFYGDDFLRLLLLRFVFCHCTLRLHRHFKGASFYPLSHPHLPLSDLLEHPALLNYILELAGLFNVRPLYHEGLEAADGD